jgi:large subunit ribosomal protein L7/L12
LLAGRLKPFAAADDDETKGKMADVTAIVDQLSALTVLEAADLVKKLEEKWGVSAAAPVAVGGGGGAPAGGAAAAPAAEAKTAFDVILVSVPADKKIAVIKAVREVKAGLGLAEAKALVEGAPKPVLEGANKADSDNAKKKLEEAGAKVEIK